ncbi:hypothetical protein CTI12_AA252170 [Artemisia annua]|uniref:Transmembrane protein n=1 Tax=Artemisia annua TaxID=35608 RepID=A0A2U1NLH0_ARTAN|nr:hypothetical protein CTI12_AA252170 [Artemisia annua]
MEDYVECRITTVIVILLLGAEICFGFLIKGTKYFVPYVCVGSVVSFILVSVVRANFFISKNKCEMRDTENRTNECSEYDWNKGLAIALDIHKCGESSEGEGDVEYESTVLERGDSSGRVEDDEYEISVCERGESRGREGDDEWKKAIGPNGYEECHATSLYATGERDVDYESKGDSRGHLGRCIYQVIRKGGDSSGCDISGVESSEHEGSVLERGDKSGWVGDEESGLEENICKGGESECDVDYKSSVLENDSSGWVRDEESGLEEVMCEGGDSSGLLGLSIYLVICEVGDNGRCLGPRINQEFMCEGVTSGRFGDHNIIVPHYDWRPSYDISLFIKWSNFIKALI